jgi:hypothetical protein
MVHCPIVLPANLCVEQGDNLPQFIPTCMSNNVDLFLFITVYDITKRSSFLSLQRWIEEVRRYTASNVMLILVGR